MTRPIPIVTRAARLLGRLVLAAGLLAAPASAQVTAYKLAVAEAAADDETLSSFYRENDYAAIWVDDASDDRARRAAMLDAVARAGLHGLPRGRYDVETIRDLLASARSLRDRGRVEVEMSRLFLRFARDLETGILEPRQVVPAIKRETRFQDGLELLQRFARARPKVFLKRLTAGSPEYARLMRQKLELEQIVEAGGWGARVPNVRLEPGASGAAVIALRDRLIAMGYLRRSDTQVYDDAMRRAVEAVQADHGLKVDGIAGEATIAALNVSPVERLGSVLVAMERERWLDRDLGKRHVWVNLTDFKARLIDNGEVVFETRSVIGKNVSDRETPEFSDVMEHMVINPSWYVPRSIVVNEYLPKLRRNPYALGHMEITDRRGRVVNRGRGFRQYNKRNFPFSMRQPPSQNNALGLVKFMFPNKYNIYLHDTPAESLFGRQVRAFSHGCIRLNDPFEFAYELLSVQSDDPKAEFKSILRTGRETRLPLKEPVPVHLVYRTAYTQPGGRMQYRRDIYGRDARILAALRRAGVVIPGLES